MEEQKTHSYDIAPTVLQNANNNKNNPSNFNSGLLYPSQFGVNSNAMVPEIQVLVIDRGRKSLISTSELLERYSYQVTRMDLSSRAMKMISSGKKHFDVVIADVDSDMDGFQFCQQVVKHGSLVILTSAMEEAHLATKAIENGALLLIRKPVNEQIIKYLRQFVMKERLQKSKGEAIRDGEMAIGMMINGGGKGIVINEGQGKNNATNTAAADKDKNINRITRMEVDKGKRKEPEQMLINPSPNKESTQEVHSDANYNEKRKCFRWTDELHANFMNAVNKLGEGKCYPKEIMEIMNEPGLTRMQVASHLQKCRNDNWRAPDKRKHHLCIHGSILRKNDAKEKGRKKVFGSMPRGENKAQAEN